MKNKLISLALAHSILWARSHSELAVGKQLVRRLRAATNRDSSLWQGEEHDKSTSTKVSLIGVRICSCKSAVEGGE